MYYLWCFTLIGLSTCLADEYSDKHGGAGIRSYEMVAHIGTQAKLSCPVNLTTCGNLHSIKWYKDTSRIFVLSTTGSRRSEGEAKDRMTMEYTAGSNQAILVIDDIQLEDEEIYRCEITYMEVQESCLDVVQIVNLTILAKPKDVRIIQADGNIVTNNSSIGPKDEGDEVELVCKVFGGKPTPMVYWYNGSSLIERAHYSVEQEDDGTTSSLSKLQLTLSRGDLNAKFSCRVESQALEDPIVTWITIDVQVRPTDMQFFGPNAAIVQGDIVKLECVVYEAKPAAKIRWTNESVDISNMSLVNTTEYENEDGTFNTTSVVEFKANSHDNGKKIRCYAENEVMKNRGETERQRMQILEVRYPPVITVSPGIITLNESTPSALVNRTLLSCTYVANPQELKGVFWYKDEQNMTLGNSKKYLGGTIENPSLIIYNISRYDMGEYICSLRNEIGLQRSTESIHLNVQYLPDVEVLMEPDSPVKAQEEVTVLLQCSVVSGNPSNLTKVRWFLDGGLMKEFPECDYTLEEKSGGPLCGPNPSILRLEQVDKTFSGNYSCQGKNLAGWGPVSKPIELVVYYPPSSARIRAYPAKVVKGETVNLDCKVDSPGYPSNVTYIWYRGSHQMTEVTPNLRIFPVRLETNSNYTCIAVNEGGESEPAHLFVNVNAPPTLFDRLKPYQGILYSAQNISLTCRVECSPLCNIVWKKNGKTIDFDKDPLYYNTIQEHGPDLQKNIFDSIESTLIWNMTAWPDNKLNKTAPNTNYTCQSDSNQVGPGVSSTIEIAVDYPPEDVSVSTKTMNVEVGRAPNPVRCQGKGHPALTYQWRRKSNGELIGDQEDLRMKVMGRSDSETYICEASNKHGSASASVYFNVMYAPECTIMRTQRNGEPALVCTVSANPPEVTFHWRVRDKNETFDIVDTSFITEDDLNSYLILDPTIDSERTYYCFAENSVGSGEKQSCYQNVAGVMPWWRQLGKEKFYIIIASLAAIIICILIICIVLLIMCRRKRANTKKSIDNQSSIAEDKAKQGVVAPVGFKMDFPKNANMNHLSDKCFYENLPFHGIQNPPNKAYNPYSCDMPYADMDFKSSYGPINYKAASIYATMKRKKLNNNLSKTDEMDLL